MGFISGGKACYAINRIPRTATLVQRAMTATYHNLLPPVESRSIRPKADALTFSKHLCPDECFYSLRIHICGVVLGNLAEETRFALRGILSSVHLRLVTPGLLPFLMSTMRQT